MYFFRNFSCDFQKTGINHTLYQVVFIPFYLSQRLHHYLDKLILQLRQDDGNLVANDLRLEPRAS